jgi:hypothetical protein
VLRLPDSRRTRELPDLPGLPLGDDGQDDHADGVRGGPNRGISLTGARGNFAKSGVADERDRDRARPPRDDEQPLKS